MNWRKNRIIFSTATCATNCRLLTNATIFRLHTLIFPWNQFGGFRIAKTAILEYSKALNFDSLWIFVLSLKTEICQIAKFHVKSEWQKNLEISVRWDEPLHSSNCYDFTNFFKKIVKVKFQNFHTAFLPKSSLFNPIRSMRKYNTRWSKSWLFFGWNSPK